ncbi:MAG: coproporphyrinogen III oxidase [Mariprofundales bacterium]
MQQTSAQSSQAKRAYLLVRQLQQYFASALEQLALNKGSQQQFSEVAWFRDGGSHGGGNRFETADGDLFCRGSINVSQVHYDDSPNKKLGSASAISTIIHPRYPLAPSIHIHISWTEMKDGNGYWRMMADLNPSNENRDHADQFAAALKRASAQYYQSAVAQGARYFFIPALNRHRGVVHFYLENHNSGNHDADIMLAECVGRSAIDSYLDILQPLPLCDSKVGSEAYAAQLAYHTLYFFQVLTLDRGTTTGLLIHNQNDLGIMGSLPAYVDRTLLTSWVKRLPHPQNILLQTLIAVLPTSQPALVDNASKIKLADAVRRHYTTHPEAIAMQASGEITTSTVNNHGNYSAHSRFSR